MQTRKLKVDDGLEAAASLSNGEVFERDGKFWLVLQGWVGSEWRKCIRLIDGMPAEISVHERVRRVHGYFQETPNADV